MVDRYSEALIELNRAIVQRRDTTEELQLYSLYDLFFGNEEIRSLFRHDFVRSFDICHPLGLPVAEKPELCRKVLMAGCHIETDALRAQIKDQDASILALYRGFSRFMLQDLSANKTMSGLTKNKCKKLASEVAFEMISVSLHMLLMVPLLERVPLMIHTLNHDGREIRRTRIWSSSFSLTISGYLYTRKLCRIMMEVLGADRAAVTRTADPSSGSSLSQASVAER